MAFDQAIDSTTKPADKASDSSGMRAAAQWQPSQEWQSALQSMQPADTSSSVLPKFNIENTGSGSITINFNMGDSSPSGFSEGQGGNPGADNTASGASSLQQPKSAIDTAVDKLDADVKKITSDLEPYLEALMGATKSSTPSTGDTSTPTSPTTGDKSTTTTPTTGDTSTTTTPTTGDKSTTPTTGDTSTTTTPTTGDKSTTPTTGDTSTTTAPTTGDTSTTTTPTTGDKSTTPTTGDTSTTTPTTGDTSTTTTPTTGDTSTTTPTTGDKSTTPTTGDSSTTTGSDKPPAGSDSGSSAPGDWIQSEVNGQKYDVLLPNNYDPSKSYPTVLYLHQLDMGTDEPDLKNEVNSWFNSPTYRSSDPSIVVMPLLDQSADPSGETVNFGGVSQGDQPGEDNAIAALKQVQQQYSVDPSRIYVTGNSLGGIGTWDMLTKYNAVNGTQDKIFAAGMPLAGNDYAAGGDNPDPSVVQQLSQVPIWAIHGAQDTQVPLGWDQALSQQLASDPNFHYTEYPDLGHDVWDTAYNDQSYWNWLFSQSAPAGGGGQTSSATA